MGGARYDIPCIAQKVPTKPSTAAAEVPPPPPKDTSTDPDSLPYLADITTSHLTPE